MLLKTALTFIGNCRGVRFVHLNRHLHLRVPPVLERACKMHVPALSEGWELFRERFHDRLPMHVCGGIGRDRSS